MESRLSYRKRKLVDFASMLENSKKIIDTEIEVLSN